MSRVAKPLGQRTVSLLVYSLTETCFDLNIIKLYIKFFAHCKDSTFKNTREFKKNDCFLRVKVTNKEKDPCGTLHAKDVTDVFQKGV